MGTNLGRTNTMEILPMLNSKMLSGLAAAAVLAFAGLAASTTPSDAKKDSGRFRCDARGPGHIQLHAKYEERAGAGRRARKKFSAEFEALAGGSYTAGQPVSFSVDSVPVGTVPLKLVVKGELAAELELDTNNPGAKKPIPPNFPAIESGTLVEASVGGKTVLGCELDPD
jgi:hypothetical protein